jgi:hypothetical protein
MIYNQLLKFPAQRLTVFKFDSQNSFTLGREDLLLDEI